MRAHEFIQEVVPFAEISFQLSTEYYPTYKEAALKNAKRLPHTKYFYSFYGANNYMILALLDENKKTFGELHILYSSERRVYYVGNIMLESEYRGFGLGLRMYQLAISHLKKPLVSDTHQSKLSRKTWARLSKSEKVKVYGVIFKKSGRNNTRLSSTTIETADVIKEFGAVLWDVIDGQYTFLFPVNINENTGQLEAVSTQNDPKNSRFNLYASYANEIKLIAFPPNKVPKQVKVFNEPDEPEELRESSSLLMPYNFYNTKINNIQEAITRRGFLGGLGAAAGLGAAKYGYDEYQYQQDLAQKRAGRIVQDKTRDTSRDPFVPEYFKDYLTRIAQQYGITSTHDLANFLSQVKIETGKWRRAVENMNYSNAELIHNRFTTNFPTVESAKPYVGNPIAIANRAYANRMGNGDETSGDGWTYRGRGFLQITGKAMYKEAGAAIHPENPNIYIEKPWLLSSDPRESALVAVWYFKKKVGLGKTSKQATDKINPAGLKTAERKRAMELIKRQMELEKQNQMQHQVKPQPKPTTKPTSKPTTKPITQNKK